jgi:hypothetical protein
MIIQFIKRKKRVLMYILIKRKAYNTKSLIYLLILFKGRKMIF